MIPIMNASSSRIGRWIVYVAFLVKLVLVVAPIVIPSLEPHGAREGG
jgi:hypothetical protein